MTFNRKEDTFIPEFLERQPVKKFEPKFIPWINDPELNQDISIET